MIVDAHKIQIHTPEGDKQAAYQHWYSVSPDQSSKPAPLLFCVHGLTRNRHDFDVIAESLAEHYQVITIDILGRGDSDHMDSSEHYGYPLYVSQCIQIIQFWLKKTGQSDIHWLGTSMGGLIGMLIASQPGSPISKLVLNDVGTFIPASALQRLADYVGRAPDFADINEVEQYLRVVAKPFGPLTDRQWQHLARYSAAPDAGGRWCLRYDPKIADAFNDIDGDIDLSDIWDAVSCPVLILRGAVSDVLTRENAEQMLNRTKTQLKEFAGIGHAPMLMADDQIHAIQNYLLSELAHNNT